MYSRELTAESLVERVTHQMPWWAISLVIHSILLFALAFLDFSTIRPFKPRALSINKWVIVHPPERPPDDEPPTTHELEPESLARTAEKTRVELAADVPREAISLPSPDKLKMPTLRGTVRDLGTDRSISTDPLVPIDEGSTFTPPMVADELAKRILEEIEDHHLLVVLLFDKSGSLVEDRKAIVGRLGTTMDELDEEMKLSERSRLRWAVVGFAEQPELVCNVTADMKEVRRQAAGMECASGSKENVLAALEFVSHTFSPLRKKMYVVLLTDEEGDDTGNPSRLRALLQKMRVTQSRLFVIGREAVFQQRRVIEWPVDALGERTGGYLYVDRGIESARQEYFSPDWLFSTRANRNVGSGFGCHALTTLCRQTGGRFFVLSRVPSPYDEALLEEYSPEWVLPDEYQHRNKRSPLRRTLSHIVGRWQACRPTHWLTKLDRLKAQADGEYRKAKKGLAFVDDAIDRLESLGGRRDDESYATKRWEANYDLTLAGLYKFRFLLDEYIHVMKQTLRKGFPKPGRRQKFNLFRIYYDWKAAEPNTGRRGRREWDRANRALDRVIEKHRGTPWARIAKHEKKYMAPLRMEPHFWVSGVESEGGFSDK